MKTTTVKAAPGRSVPLSATCRRPDGGPNTITADHGEVEVEQRDAAAELYVRRAIARGDLVAVAPLRAGDPPSVKTLDAAPDPGSATRNLPPASNEARTAPARKD